MAGQQDGHKFALAEIILYRVHHGCVMMSFQPTAARTRSNMSASQSRPNPRKQIDRSSLMLMLSYVEAEARALGVEDAARHIAYAAMLMDVPQQPDWGLALIETQGRA
jgi:hypothetical protein